MNATDTMDYLLGQRLEADRGTRREQVRSELHRSYYYGSKNERLWVTQVMEGM